MDSPLAGLFPVRFGFSGARSRDQVKEVEPGRKDGVGGSFDEELGRDLGAVRARVCFNITPGINAAEAPALPVLGSFRIIGVEEVAFVKKGLGDALGRSEAHDRTPAAVSLLSS